MKRNYGLAAGILLVFFCMVLGCEKKEKEQENLLLLPVTDRESDAASQETGMEIDGMPEGTEKPSNAVDDSVRETDAMKYCVVHICGAVKEPGVYTLEGVSRIYQAVEKAGGFREDAARDYLNQADLITDGMKIYIPTEAEVEETGMMNNWDTSGSDSADEKNLLVNINTAGEELLCTLPGVGSTKAKSIISYREKNGPFEAKEDIMNVEGIKDGLFEKIKDSITV
ncbi:MAG: ComEA family DNA-binding protein [Lachnospiraceae bacterium]|nr:ComEA family DNA-binding protein [Lachnospiraceae bacterium]